MTDSCFGQIKYILHFVEGSEYRARTRARAQFWEFPHAVHNVKSLIRHMVLLLVYLDRGIYLSHECVGTDISDRSAHDT